MNVTETAVERVDRKVLAKLQEYPITSLLLPCSDLKKTHAFMRKGLIFFIALVRLPLVELIYLNCFQSFKNWAGSFHEIFTLGSIWPTSLCPLRLVDRCPPPPPSPQVSFSAHEKRMEWEEWLSPAKRKNMLCSTVTSILHCSVRDGWRYQNGLKMIPPSPPSTHLWQFSKNHLTW